MSTCIVVSAPLSDQAQIQLNVSQVIETLAYHREKKRVDITFDVLVDNPTPNPGSLKFIHRGVVTVALERFPEHPTEPRDNILRKVYQQRIRASGKSNHILFHPRVNCFGFQPEGVEVFTVPPEQLSLIADDFGQSALTPDSLIPFTSFVVRGFPAYGKSLFRIRMTIENPTYDCFVSDDESFSVDGSGRLMDYIAFRDLPRAPNDSWQKLFEREICPGHIVPSSYDVVILKPPLCEALTVLPGTAQIAEIPLPEEGLEEQAYWFAARSEFFYLDLKYLPPVSLAESPDLLTSTPAIN
ncbi:MAG: hypothetical protein ACD_78C00030G0001 [uncultured bacterium (gcode 4)]|uniref:Uncharacterized protein n=1 Tax=uncultured bacterium (gcode 4) TaxID=1234023 RepID=K1XZW1_9BACT|nr:MAG: hypothetical protein ACD_78C00030G0001 [uncultured bacterium (gcode 4)]